MKRDYTKGRVVILGKSNKVGVEAFGEIRGANIDTIEQTIREACAEAAADATKRERKRAARIVRAHESCECRPKKESDCGFCECYGYSSLDQIAAEILGTPKGAKP